MDTVISILVNYGIFGIIVAAFFEAILFPPPVEIILLPVMLANRQNAILYALITVSVSMTGAIVGYNLGRAAGRPFLVRLFKENRVESVKQIYNTYGVAAIITSAFTPIPYEVYTLSAGAFRMNFIKFLAAAFIGRIIRYIPEGIIIQLFGHAISNRTFTNVSIIVTLIIVVIVIYIAVKRKVSKRG